ncbi:MAG: hypothetical protein ACU0CO_17070 [Shimia sp.]
MHTIILTGVLDFRPQLAICHDAADLRGALRSWFAELVPDLDFETAAPQRIEDEVDEAMAPSDWTALECFPMTDDGRAFTGDSIGIALALACYAEEEEDR